MVKVTRRSISSKIWKFHRPWLHSNMVLNDLYEIWSVKFVCSVENITRLLWSDDGCIVSSLVLVDISTQGWFGGCYLWRGGPSYYILNLKWIIRGNFNKKSINNCQNCSCHKSHTRIHENKLCSTMKQI